MKAAYLPKSITAILVAVFLIQAPLSSALDKKLEGNLIFWVYALHSSNTTKNKVQVYINDMTLKTGININSYASTDFEQFLETCQHGSPHIAFISYDQGKTLIKKCSYSPIANTFQDIHLIGKEQLNETAKHRQINVGLIRVSKARDIARRELPDHYSNIRFSEYINILDLIRSMKKDNLDAIALPYGMIKNIKILKDFKPVFKFDEQGQTTILTSPLIDKKNEKKIQEFILSNSIISKNVWQEKFGLGPFVPFR